MAFSYSTTSNSIRVEQHNAQPIRPAMRYSLGVSLSGCLMGITIAFSASALCDFNDDYYLTKPNVVQKQWFSSLAALAAGISGIAFGRFVNMMGKKHALALSAVFYFVGYSMIAYSKGYTLLFAGRIVTGLGVGCTCLTLSPYISEISPTNHRGKFASIMQLQVQLGILVIAILGISPLQFRWNASACSFLAVLNLICIVVAPETPRWLISKRKLGDARRALERLMEEDPDLIDDEIQVLQRSTSEDHSKAGDSISFTSKQNIKPLLLMSTIMIFQQLTAISMIMAHSNDIFESLELPEPRMWSAAMAAGFFLFTFGSAALADRAGRKGLLIAFAIMISLSLCIFSAARFLQDLGNVHIAVLSVALCCYVVAYSMAWGSIPWVLCGELFTVENQGRALAIIGASAWPVNFLTVFSYSYFMDHNYGRYLFLVYGGCMAVAAAFVGMCLPETKGLSLYEVGRLFADDVRYVRINAG